MSLFLPHQKYANKMYVTTFVSRKMLNLKMENLEFSMTVLEHMIILTLITSLFHSIRLAGHGQI